MKLRYLILIIALAFLLTACNMTLAEDITPPPNYIAPTPVPTLVLFPAQPPNLANGAAIYAEKCAACHGTTGLGDGEQGIQLSVTVRAFGLAEIARPASPAQYYTMVTRGNIERFMPPFNSLTDQERWDVTGYVLTLHTPPDQIERGKQLFEENCADCPTDYFEDQQVMSGLTAVGLARLANQGNDQIPAFGSNFSDDELWDVAAYLRTLSFDASPQTPPEVVSANPTPAAAITAPIGTSQASAESEATVIPEPGFGTITGTVENKTGASLPSALDVTLRGFDHDVNDPSVGPVEVLSLEAGVNTDGTYVFENVEIPANRIFVTEVTTDDITLQSGFAIVEEGMQSLNMPVLTLYTITEDTSALVMDEVQIILEYGADSIAVYGLYSFRNPGDEIVVVPQTDTGEIPFIKFPVGAFGTGFEPTQDSENFTATDNGFAIPPSENPYQLIAFSSVARSDELDFSQSFALPVSTITFFLPVGVEIQNSQLADLGAQTIQNFTYQVYQSQPVDAGGSLDLVVSGAPQDSETASGTAARPNNGLLLGAVGVGIALIVAGLWMYRQDKTKEVEDAPEDEFDSAEDVMDAIIALDDLHGKKKISEMAYKKKRAKLKDILKGML
ncbi:MAG TPA: c-type cytochrome [Anaerolineales bacterium]|nr:c-type cytochrome [Anaerolineales bacterium]